MQALIVPEKGKLKLAEIPAPQIGDYQALVKVEVCGICSSTDWKVINGQMPWAGPCPLVLGHESVGVVQAVGDKVRNYAVGDRVTRVVYPRSSELNSAFGGFGDYGIVTDARSMAADGDPSLMDDYVAQRQLVVPKGLDPVRASLAISLAETASGLIDLPNLRNRTVAVAGTGVAGLAFTLWAKLAGARVITLGRRAGRLQRACDVGADAVVNTTESNWQQQVQDQAGGRVDGVLEAIGDVAFAAELQPLIREDGFAAAYGAPPDGQAFPVGWKPMDVREQAMYGWVADLLLRGWIKPEWFISHTWDRLDDAPAAFEAVRRGEVLKGFIFIP